MQKVIERIIKPTITGITDRKSGIQRFIFFGLIKVDDEPIVIEYNCRMGDPESEVVLLRLKNDLVQLFVAVQKTELNKEKIIIDPRCAATIVAVSGGYPGEYEKGKAIDFGYLENPTLHKNN